MLGDPAFLATVRIRAHEIFSALTDGLSGSPLVERISWLGLLGGIRLRDPEHPWLTWQSLGAPELEGAPISAPLVVERLCRRGILAQVCGFDWSVLRIEPPLVVDAETGRRFVREVMEAIGWLEINGR